MERTTCSFRTVLETVAGGKTPGPSATFSVLHIVLAMQAISEEPIGRIKLAERLGVGEGAARTIVGRLKDQGLITVSKKGCLLTEEGTRLWREYRSVFKKAVSFGNNQLTNSTYNCAILVNKSESKVESGIVQRDAAIKAGARSATTMMFKDGTLRIPTVSEDLAKDFPEVSRQIIGLLQPRESDVIIIGSGDSPREAEYGTIAAAWTLCQ